MSRALVLGGGGVTGIAWEVGALHGLAEGGVDIRTWDRVVGTSAGAIVGTRILGDPDWDAYFRAQAHDDTSAEDRLVLILAGRIGGAMLLAGRRRSLAWLPRLWLAAFALETMVRRAARAPRSRRPVGDEVTPTVVADPDLTLARIGSLALVARTAPERRFLDIVAGAVAPVADWPGPLTVTAVDARSGATVAFDRSTGAPLVAAVAASAAVPTLMPPIRVGGRSYVDGGITSQTHAYLAADHDEIVIVAPLDMAPLPAEAAELRRAGRRVHIVAPSAEAREIIGRDIALLDPARRARSARAGRADGLRAAAAILGTGAGGAGGAVRAGEGSAA